MLLMLVGGHTLRTTSPCSNWKETKVMGDGGGTTGALLYSIGVSVLMQDILIKPAVCLAPC